ncbi:RDD family protein [Candidatus Poseidoniales archaeon]|nr:RDD family protein [Candidatus Poseidoniales archaeon]
MGLLDKASDTSTKTSEASTKPKAKAVAVAKAKPVKAVAVAKAKPAKAVKAAKPVKAPRAAKPAKDRRPILNNTGLPDGYEIATKNARFLAWLMNFVWNFGVLFAALFVSVAGSTPTLPAIAALLMIITNVFVIPIMTGRTLGNFISRTRYITANESKPNPVHGFLVNSVGLMGLTGFGLVVFNMGQLFDENSGKLVPVSLVFLIIGLVLVIARIIDGRFKSNSDQNQGLYDMLFGAFLVKYVPQEGEEMSGIAARLNRMGNYGDSFTQRREAASKKKAQKVAKVATKVPEEGTSTDKVTSEESKDTSKDESKDSENTE